MNNQPPIPGLEPVTKAPAATRQKSLREELKALRGRVLRLELEVALFTIQLEKEVE